MVIVARVEWWFFKPVFLSLHADNMRIHFEWCSFKPSIADNNHVSLESRLFKLVISHN